MFELTNKVLGEGAFGVVKMAIHKETGTKVAVKIMEISKLQNDGVEDEIRTELEAAEQTTHVNIVRVLQLYQTDRELFIVLELMLRDLEDQFESSGDDGFYPETIVHILAQLFNVLKYIHQKRKMAHRDLKLKNILVEEYNQEKKKCYIKLTDFGLAAHLGSNENATFQSDVGTLPYKAPEILRGEKHDEKVDIWAVGVIAYMLFSGGEWPFYDEENEDEFKRQILEDEPSWEHFEELPPLAVKLLKTLLNKDPSKRPSAAQIAGNPFFDTHTWTVAQKDSKI